MIEREFAGEVRRFELVPANRRMLYRGAESAEHGNLAELAKRAARGDLGIEAVIHILSHALSGGHPITLLRMRKLVRDEVQSHPLADLTPLAVEVIVEAFAGRDDDA